MNSDKLFLTLCDQYCNPEWGFKLPEQSHASFEASALPPGHHGQYFVYLLFLPQNNKLQNSKLVTTPKYLLVDSKEERKQKIITKIHRDALFEVINGLWDSFEGE